MDSTQLQVAIVEDHTSLRDILRQFIGDLACVAGCRAFGSAEAALGSLGEASPTPDLLLVDLSLPGMSGIELIRQLRASHPRLRCAILSAHRSPAYVGQALAAGAAGFILKGDPLEIERGISAICQGERFVSAELR